MITGRYKKVLDLYGEEVMLNFSHVVYCFVNGKLTLRAGVKGVRNEK